jgi:hypothetical protein
MLPLFLSEMRAFLSDFRDPAGAAPSSPRDQRVLRVLAVRSYASSVQLPHAAQLRSPSRWRRRLGFGRTKLIRQGSQSVARPARLDCHVHKINGAMTRSELKFNSMSGCQAACILPHCSPAAQLRRCS